MNRDLLIERLCSEYCSFYRPDREEDLACGSFVILQKLLEVRHEVPVCDKDRTLMRQTEDEISETICCRCPFYSVDCDYAAWRRGELAGLKRKDVNPCGGFIYLGLAVEHGSLDIQMIDRVS